MTAEELQKAGAAYRAASRHAEKLREARNALVQAALAEGWTHARISQTTGLSRGRISQIAQSRQERLRLMHDEREVLARLAQ